MSLSQLREPKFCFEVGFRGANSRTYTLSAESEESMTSWMRALTHASFQYLRMMVLELQRQVTELTDQKRDTAPLGIDRVDSVAVPSALKSASVRSSKMSAPPRPPPPSSVDKALGRPLKTHAQEGTCGASSAQAIGYAGAADNDSDLISMAVTPPREHRSSTVHVSYSSPGFARRQHLAPSDDPTPLLQPEKTHNSGASSTSSLLDSHTSTSLADSNPDDDREPEEEEETVDGGAAQAEREPEVGTAEEELQRLSFHSMHYNSSFLRDSPLSPRSAALSKDMVS